MRHFLTFSLLLFFGTCFCQGNLQFNQVLTYGGILCASCNNPIGSVPVGKVWKIESQMGSTHLNINNINFNTFTPQVPIWLKAGDVVIMNGFSSTQSWFLSIIEFNLVP